MKTWLSYKLGKPEDALRRPLYYQSRLLIAVMQATGNIFYVWDENWDLLLAKPLTLPDRYFVDTVVIELKAIMRQELKIDPNDYLNAYYE